MGAICRRSAGTRDGSLTGNDYVPKANRALPELTGVLRQATRGARDAREREREREREMRNEMRHENRVVVYAKVNKYIHIAYVSFVQPKKGIKN